MMIVHYESKAQMNREFIGKPLTYTETSMFGAEYKENGTFIASNRPHITGFKREFFAEITMEDGKIKVVK